LGIGRGEFAVVEFHVTKIRKALLKNCEARRASILVAPDTIGGKESHTRITTPYGVEQWINVKPLKGLNCMRVYYPAMNGGATNIKALQAS
jgi:hypothetical protein